MTLCHNFDVTNYEQLFIIYTQIHQYFFAIYILLHHSCSKEIMLQFEVIDFFQDKGCFAYTSSPVCPKSVQERFHDQNSHASMSHEMKIVVGGPRLKYMNFGPAYYTGHKILLLARQLKKVNGLPFTYRNSCNYNKNDLMFVDQLVYLPTCFLSLPHWSEENS